MIKLIQKKTKDETRWFVETNENFDNGDGFKTSKAARKAYKYFKNLKTNELSFYESD